MEYDFYFHVASSVVIFVLFLFFIFIYCIVFNYLLFFVKNVLLKYRLWIHQIYWL